MKKITLTLIMLFLFAGLARAEIGIASFYTIKSSGRITANGERYNQEAMTCASMEYKFNTILKITNIENGKAVIVRVTDRGNFKKYGRIIDLSKGAFAKIADTKLGVIKVKVEVVK
jgi:rare lipoprotein A